MSEIDVGNFTKNWMKVGTQVSSIFGDDLSLGVNDREYEVSLTPHPDFGIGLRLEAQQDGLPAIVGSYKKHPLSGGRLPAERNGMIMVRSDII